MDASPSRTNLCRVLLRGAMEDDHTRMDGWHHLSRNIHLLRRAECGQRRSVVVTGEAISRHLCPFGLVGIVPDAMLAAVLLFARTGHWMQQVGVMFHAFTALTMAQRSGYAFPATMMAAGELFRPVDGEKTNDDTNVTSETTVDPLSSSHASWMQRN